jgi:hypothetical protein
MWYSQFGKDATPAAMVAVLGKMDLTQDIIELIKKGGLV